MTKILIMLCTILPIATLAETLTKTPEYKEVKLGEDFTITQIIPQPEDRTTNLTWLIRTVPKQIVFVDKTYGRSVECQLGIEGCQRYTVFHFRAIELGVGKLVLEYGQYSTDSIEYQPSEKKETIEISVK